jgi:hypothetical protein
MDMMPEWLLWTLGVAGYLAVGTITGALMVAYVLPDPAYEDAPYLVGSVVAWPIVWAIAALSIPVVAAHLIGRRIESASVEREEAARRRENEKAALAREQERQLATAREELERELQELSTRRESR